MKISLYSGQVGYPEGVDVLFTPYRLHSLPGVGDGVLVDVS